jgi:hypothetical protein
MRNKQRRIQILRKVEKLPPDKLKMLYDYLSRLEKESPSPGKVLSYAGVWDDIDESTLKDFTDHIISRRQKTRRRFGE